MHKSVLSSGSTIISFNARQIEILRETQDIGFVGIDTLSKRFAVSAQTIRRDVNELCALGELRRIRGGVASPPKTQNVDYSKRRVLNERAKKNSARLINRHIPNGSSIALSIGTTPEICINCLSDKTGLKIYTNNLHVAMHASAHADWTVSVPGGKIRAGDCDILGNPVEEFFGKYSVDFGIFGVAGISENGDLFDFSEEEVACRTAIQANCRTSFLVLDHSKFGRTAHVRGGHITDAAYIFCDTTPPPSILDALSSSSTRLVTSKQGRNNAE